MGEIACGECEVNIYKVCLFAELLLKVECDPQECGENHSIRLLSVVGEICFKEFDRQGSRVS